MTDTYIRQLHEQRLRAWNQAQGLLDDVAAQRRDMSGEEHATYNRMMRDLDDLDVEIRDRIERRDREHQAARLRETNLSVFGEARTANREAAENEHLRRWLRGETWGVNQLEIDLQRAQREAQLVRDGASPAEVRALAWDASSGSLTVPTSMARSLYESLEANIAAFRMGATVMNTTSGESMQLPILSTHAVATQVAGQGTTFAGTDPVFGRLQLDAFKYGQLIRASNELITDSAVDISAMLGRDLGRALGRVIDTDLIVGSGSGKPRGVMTAAGAAGAGSVTTGGSLVTPSYDTLINAVYGLNDSYRANGAVWLMKDSTAGTIRKLRDGAGGTVGAPLWEPSLTAGQPDTLLGYPVYTDPNVAAMGSNARIAAFVDPTAYYVRQVGNPVIEVDRSVYFSSDESAFRGKWRIDGDTGDTAAFSSIVMNV